MSFASLETVLLLLLLLILLLEVVVVGSSIYCLRAIIHHYRCTVEC